MIAPFAHEFFVGRKYGGWVMGRERFVSEQHAQDASGRLTRDLRKADMSAFACRVAPV